MSMVLRVTKNCTGSIGDDDTTIKCCITFKNDNILLKFIWSIVKLFIRVIGVDMSSMSV